MSVVPVTISHTVELEIDGESVRVREGATILDACRAQGRDQPDALLRRDPDPVNACRVCVVEVEGSRVLVPSCSRKVEDGMVVKTDSERVRHSRKMVLEFLGSCVDLSTAPNVDALDGRVRAPSPSGTARRRRPPRRARATAPRPGITTPATARRPRPSPSR